jgi:hypothetical protein
MDWVERLFGVSPDGGSGMLELAIVIAVALTILGIATSAARRASVAKRSKDRSG